MAVCPKYKIDSNATGLRFAEEVCYKQLPTLAADGNDPFWKALEPNSYNDFGGQFTNTARNPINPSRQRKKGTITGLEASGGFQQDLTFFNTREIMQGFMFADFREKKTLTPTNGDAIAVTGVTAADDTYTTDANGGTGFSAGMLVIAEGFGIAANNGVKRVTAATGTTIVVAEALTDEAAPPAGATVSRIGLQGAAGDLSIALDGDLVRLVSAALNFTTMGLVPGEWIYIGGDLSIMGFENNGGFARIGSIAAGYLVLDKVDWTPEAEAGGVKTVQVYFGMVLKNESDPALIKRRSYQLERTLGEDADGTMSEYLVGAVPNELTLNVPQEDKVTIDLSFVAADHQGRSGAVGVKDGTRVGVVEGDAFNTSSDFTRIKIASVPEDGGAAPIPLFAFMTDLTITVNNNVSGAKAIGVLGSFDANVGTFEVGGSLTGYFASIDAVNAVRNNASITLDAIMVKDNQAIVWDMPLLTLGNGRLNVEQDQPVTIPLDTAAAESDFGHTLLLMFFPWLPNAAAL